MATSGQVRDACDRCHSIKTRCERIAGDQLGCQRCDRLGQPCSYSPPGQTGRPPGGRKRKEPDGAAAEAPDRSSRQIHRSPERSGDPEKNINVAHRPAARTLPSPEASEPSVFPDDVLHLTPPEPGQYQVSFGLQDFSISPWPYYTPDMISPSDITMDTQNETVSAYPPPPPSHAPSRAALQPYRHGHQGGSTSQHDASITASDTIHIQLMQLANLQSRLLVLGKSVAEESDSLSSIEEVLIVTESFISIFQTIEPLCYRLAVKNTNTSAAVQLTPTQQQKETKTSQTAIFLVSNCYLNLIDIFETLVAQLQNERSFGEATQDRGHPPQQTLVSIGSTGVSLGRQAAAEVHLHLVVRMFDRLSLSLGARGETDKSDGDKIAQSIASLAGRAVRSLAMLEERIADRRGKAKFVMEE